MTRVPTADPAAVGESAPLGMVDHLPGAGVTEEALAFARAYLAEGEMDPAAIAMIRDPGRIAARQAAATALRAADWPALGHYRDANAALAGQPVDAVFIGDSITEMWGVAHPGLFGEGVVNRGVSGQTSPQILLRFMADVVALKPRLVHLMCGANDVAGNTGPTTPQDYGNNIRAMADLARANGITMILAGITPFDGLAWAPQIGGTVARLAELNAWLAGFACERGLVHADYFPALATNESALNPLYTRDGLHPTRLGYDAMRPVAEAALAEARARQA